MRNYLRLLESVDDKEVRSQLEKEFFKLRKDVRKWKSISDRYHKSIYIDHSMIPWTIRFDPDELFRIDEERRKK